MVSFSDVTEELVTFMFLEAVGHVDLLRALILEHCHHLVRRLEASVGSCCIVVVLHWFFDSIVEHLPFRVRICHVLSDRVTHERPFVADQTSTTAQLLAHILVYIDVWVFYKLPHDSLLSAEVTRSAEHIGSVAALLGWAIK